MSTKQGIVEKIYEKNGMYSIIMEDIFYSTYKTKPACNEGDEVVFQFVQKGRFYNADPKTVEVVSATPAAKASAEAGGSGNNKQDIIQYQAARNTAMAFLTVAISEGAVKLPAKQADKYDAFMSLLHDVTDQFFEEAANLGPVAAPTPPAAGYEDE